MIKQRGAARDPLSFIVVQWRARLEEPQFHCLVNLIFVGTLNGQKARSEKSEFHSYMRALNL